jgi:hypothetical protein
VRVNLWPGLLFPLPAANASNCVGVFPRGPARGNENAGPVLDGRVRRSRSSSLGPGSLQPGRGTGSCVQERSELERESLKRPPREEFAYKEVNTPSRAERRPARDDLPPRRILATVPAQTKPSCTGAVLLEFDSLIKHHPQVLTCPQQQGHAPPIRCAEKNPYPTRPPHAILTPVPDVRGARHRGGLPSKLKPTPSANPASRRGIAHGLNFEQK